MRVGSVIALAVVIWKGAKEVRDGSTHAKIHNEVSLDAVEVW